MSKQILRANLKEAEKKGYLKEKDLKEAYGMGIINRAEYRKILTRTRKAKLK